MLRLARILRPAAAIGLAAAFATTSAQAAILSFTDPGAFNATIFSLSAGTQNFESFAPGDSIVNNSTVGNLTYMLGSGLNMRVDSLYSATSGSNYLGLDNADGAFASGDILTLGLSGNYRAVGLYVIGSPGDMRAGDVALTVAGGHIDNAASPAQTLADGGEAFFLGLLATTAADEFSVATLASFGDPGNPYFLWNVDDITTAVAPNNPPPPGLPEPASLALLLAGCVAAVVSRNGTARVCIWRWPEHSINLSWPRLQALRPNFSTFRQPFPYPAGAPSRK